jgi:hypothetical protein
MSVVFVSGKPGGGKSYWALKEFVMKELAKGERTVITNLDVKPGFINEWLQKHAPRDVTRRDIDIHKRLIVLTREQTTKFYLYRPEDYRFEDPEDQWEKDKFSGENKKLGYKKPRINLARAFRGFGEEQEEINPAELGGVVYVIDEVHEYFNAREWAETGRSALSYLSQHRKLGDDVVCITQSIQNVDKQFRSVAQEFQYVRNYNKEKVWMFRSFPFFEVKFYLTPADGANSQPFDATRFTLDQKITCCYDTAAGVGVSGGSADTKQKRSGLPMSVLVGLVLVGIAALVMAPTLISSALGGAAKDVLNVGNETEASEKDLAKAGPGSRTSASRDVQPVKTETPVQQGDATRKGSGVTKTPPIPRVERDLVAISVVSGIGHAYFDDGLEVTTEDPRVFKLGRDYVIFDGHLYEKRRSRPGQ